MPAISSAVAGISQPGRAIACLSPPFSCRLTHAELFGHWWFEGPQWIYHVLREISYQHDLALTTPGEYLNQHPIPAKGHSWPEQLGQERLQRALGQSQDRLDVAAVA